MFLNFYCSSCCHFIFMMMIIAMKKNTWTPHKQMQVCFSNSLTFLEKKKKGPENECIVNFSLKLLWFKWFKH